jgi:hypothetical protein
MLGLLICIAGVFATTPSAWAQSINLTASPASAAINVQATGTADSCGAYCSGQTVEVELSPASDYSPDCITPMNPQATTPVPADGGAFNLTTTIPDSPGQQYTACAYLMDTIGGISAVEAASQPVVVTLVPAACAGDTAHLLSLSAPGTVAHGRRATIVIASNNDGQPVTSGSVTVAPASGGPPLLTHTFSAGDLSAFNNSSGQRAFSFAAPAGTAPVSVTLSYVEAEAPFDPTSAQCVDTRAATVRPTAGSVPSASLQRTILDDVDANLSAPGGCTQTQPTPVTVLLRSGRTSLTLSSRDTCRPGSWRSRGRTPGVSARPSVSGSGSSIRFQAVGQVNRSYRLTIKVGRRIVKQGTLTVTYEHIPATRVFQGTDQFVNYCIDQSQTVYSYHLRLFCWLPGVTIRNLRLSRFH